MEKKLRFLGLDVHAETIAAAVAEPDGEVRSLGVIPNRAESVRKLVKRLGAAEPLRACYEAGPTGYVLYWQLTELGVDCAVVAPTLVPTKAGDRVKTDRRDAVKLARCHRAGDLTPVWVPDEDTEALRDLVRAREAAKQDQLRARRDCAGDSRVCRRTSKRWPGRHSFACTSATPDWPPPARTSARWLSPWGANCSALSGPSVSGRKAPPPGRWQHERQKAKAFLIRKNNNPRTE